MSKQMLQLTRMVADPCNAQVVSGLYGDDSGYIIRHKRMTAAGENLQDGYYLWCPSGYANPTPGKAINSIFFNTGDRGVHPVNTVANPLGSGQLTGSGIAGYSNEHAGDSFAESNVCAKVRAAAACFRMLYVNTTSGCRGRIGFIEGLSTTSVLQLPSPDDLMSIATKTERTTLDPMEVTFRPDDEVDSRYKEAAFGPIRLGTPDTDQTTITEFGDKFDPKWIGFVWIGVPSDHFSFETIRISEWQPDIGLGFTNVVPTTTADDSLVKPVLRALDQTAPGWSTSMYDHVSSAVSSIANTALAGASRQAINMIGGRAAKAFMY